MSGAGDAFTTSQTGRSPITSAVSAEQIRRRLAQLQAGDVPTHGGRTLAYVYDSGLAQADDVGRSALSTFAASNGLDPTAFPSLLAMENDLVALAGDLLEAPEGYAGVVTSGGTESILLAVLAARDAASNSAAQRDRPSMVLPTSAHAAFHKAAHYFGVRPVFVDVDPSTFRADAQAMAAVVDESTILIVGSAPSYAHGVIDPIAAIAALGVERGIRVHVDACIGGLVLPFLDGLAPWNFAVPGVSSISVDLHKYGYTPKGISILLHRDAALRRGHFFAAADWPGYTMLNTTMQSTKSGGPLAAAWAVTTFIGREGYRTLARTAREATVELAARIPQIDPGLRVLAAPESTLLAVTATADAGFDIFTLADRMAERGWLLSPQLPFRESPASLHLSLCAATAPRLQELLGALTESVTAAREAGPVTVDPAIADVIGRLDPAHLDEAAFEAVLAMAGIAGMAGEAGDGSAGSGPLPDAMAPINALLAVAPPRLREALLLAFIDRLTRPRELS